MILDIVLTMFVDFLIVFMRKMKGPDQEEHSDTSTGWGIREL